MDIHQFSYLETSLFLRNELVQYITKNGGVTEGGGAVRDGRLTISRIFN